MRYRRLAALMAAALVVFPAGTAAAQTRDTIQVRVSPQAALVGTSIEVSVRVRCEPFGEPLESNITVSQDDQAVFAQQGLPAVDCDRRWHTLTVVATPLEGSFHTGEAFASAFVSRLDPATGEVRQGQDSRAISVR
jgi:hypothetical protein